MIKMTPPPGESVKHFIGPSVSARYADRQKSQGARFWPPSSGAAGTCQPRGPPPAAAGYGTRFSVTLSFRR